MTTSPLTLWKEEAKHQFRREYRTAYKDILSPSVLEEGNAWFENFLDTLIDRIHAHTLEEVREIVKQTPPNWNLMAFESGELIERDQISAALELLEHPTDI